MPEPDVGHRRDLKAGMRTGLLGYVLGQNTKGGIKRVLTQMGV